MKIPNGWKKVKFGDVVSKINDKVSNREEWTFERYIGGEHFDEGEIIITRSAPIEGNEEVIGSAFHMRFKPGHVLYVTRNPRLRKGGMVDFEGVCSNVSFVMETDEKQLLQSLLPFVIQTEDFVKHTCNNAHGSTNPFLNWKDIAKYEFLLPPIEEQKKISETLWSIQDNLKKLQDLNFKTLNIKEMIMNEFIGSKLSFQAEEINTHHSNKFIKLSDFLSVNPRRELIKKEIHRCINMADLYENDPKIKSSEEKPFKGSGSKFSNGDTLLARITPCLENGKIAYVDILNKDEVARGSTEFIVLSGKEKFSLNKLVYYLAITPIFKNEAINSMIGTSGRQRVPNSLFDRIKIENIPIKEQEKIINLLENVDNTLIKQKEKNLSLKNLRNKLSNELLKGALRLD